MMCTKKGDCDVVYKTGCSRMSRCWCYFCLDVPSKQVGSKSARASI